MAVEYINRLSSIANSTSPTKTGTSTGNFTLLTKDVVIAHVVANPTSNQLPTASISNSAGASIQWSQLSSQATSPNTTSTTLGTISTIFIGLVTSGGTASVTTNLSNGTYTVQLNVYQFRGLSTTQVNSPYKSIGDTTPQGPGEFITPSGNAGDLVIWFNSMTALGTYTPTYSTSTEGGTWSTGQTNGGGTTYAQSSTTQYKILTNSGAQNAFYTNNYVTTRPWVMQAFVIAAADSLYTGWGSPI